MKSLSLTLMILLMAQIGFAKYSCNSDGKQLVLDPSSKSFTFTKDGTPHRFKILNPANHGFEMFGHTTKAFEVEGGLVVGVKDTKNSKLKDLSIFDKGEAIAKFSDCTEKN